MKRATLVLTTMVALALSGCSKTETDTIASDSAEADESTVASADEANADSTQDASTEDAASDATDAADESASTDANADTDSASDATDSADTSAVADSDAADTADSANADAADAAPSTSDAAPSTADATSDAASSDAADASTADADASTADAAEPTGTRTATEQKLSGDWPMWGGTAGRNMVNSTTGISINFKPARTPEEGKNLIWTAELGSQTYANPVVADGRVYVGCNNGAAKRPKYPSAVDLGVILAFEEETGKFLWQLTREKLPDGRVNDWPDQGICSTVCVEENRVYVVTNRAELMCVDAEGFYDGENDGAFQEEVDKEQQDADIIWSLDMIEELGVFPHNLATSSPVIHGDLVFILTSNGVDEAHLELPSPRAPSFLAVNKMTGEIVWEDNTPFDKVLHGQWSSPAVGVVNGQAQVYFAAGDGWLYALEAETGKHIWKFDLNPKDSVWELGGAGSRNAVIATPVFYENSVVVAVGQDPEHAEGVGHIYRVDATKKGDVSPVTEDGKANPNSAEIWHLGGIDTDGSVTGEEEGLIFRRTMSTVAIHDGLVYAADLSGFLHCIDLESGKRYWEHDTFSGIWGSPMVADGKVFLGDEDGEMTILAVGKKEKKLGQKLFQSSVYSTPTIANGRLFVADRARLYVFSTTDE